LEYRAFAKCIFQKNYRSALVDFMAVLKFDKKPTSIDHPYDYYIGLCYLQMNQFDSAENMLSRCIADEGANAASSQEWFYLGIVKMENKKYSKAIESFQKCLQLSDHFSDAQYYLSVCLVKYRRYNAAYNLVKLALANFRNGYTFEDSYSDFEYYPYQINRDLLNEFITKLKMDHSVADAK
jgi:tetratricopeptide (TPR) repeat protein